MPKNIQKCLSLNEFGIPFVGLLLTLSIFADHPKPVRGDEITQNASSISSLNSQEPANFLSRQNSLTSQSSLVSPTQVRNHSKQFNTISVAVIKPQTQVKNSKLAPPGTKLPKQDGVYLYGQSPKPGQIGQGYIVFENRQGKVTGALYMPRSEFSCFNGTLSSKGELAMTVTGYPGETSLSQVATSSSIPRLSDDEPSNYASSIALQQYHPINTISANDRQIVQQCKATTEE